ncbi:MAG: ferrous iron transport protein B [Eubacteriales bacterium]|nr:ferrous iron transport protein B [Eubacteriales bacterium]
MKYTIALIGNQNSGKTTLFNQLTGSNQHVGNFPGVTVEKKSGIVRRKSELEIVDLPGIYSLSPYSTEEMVTLDFILKEKVDGIINIADATNLERNLYLTLQVLELGIPAVLALNMMDEVISCGNSIDVRKLEAELGIPVVPVVASRNRGIDDLVDQVALVVSSNIKPEKYDFCTGEVHRAIHAVAHVIEDKARASALPVRFTASKLVEGDDRFIKEMSLTPAEIDIIGHLTEEMESELGKDRESALADMRYEYIEKLSADAVSRSCSVVQQSFSSRLDKWLTHKYLAIPIFVFAMVAIFYLTFGLFGSWLSDSFAGIIEYLIMVTGDFLDSVQINIAIRSLVVEGILSGVGSVLSFLPTILILFFFLSILEDTGYMSRIAFVMDRLLRKMGLSGQAFVPMLIGFGCSVPAVMATRTLSGERDRKITMMLIPFMSCSAKVPIYIMFAAAFFPGKQAAVMTILYFTGMLVAVLTGLVLKKIMYHSEPTPFLMEMPAYRLPSVKSVFLNIYEKAKDFITRAFTVILLATMMIWFLRSFDFRLDFVSDNSDSMLAGIGTLLVPIFRPLGFGNWMTSTALITGLTAKEAVISTFAVLTSSPDNTSLIASLQNIFTPLQAASFLVFTLLYMPCVATLAVIRRELGSLAKAGSIMFFQTGIAWAAAFILYQTGSLFVK